MVDKTKPKFKRSCHSFSNNNSPGDLCLQGFEDFDCDDDDEETAGVQTLVWSFSAEQSEMLLLTLVTYALRRRTVTAGLLLQNIMRELCEELRCLFNDHEDDPLIVLCLILKTDVQIPTDVWKGVLQIINKLGSFTGTWGARTEPFFWLWNPDKTGAKIDARPWHSGRVYKYAHRVVSSYKYPWQLC